jgi:hypothetical protein
MVMLYDFTNCIAKSSLWKSKLTHYPRFVRVSHDIPISEYPLCFLDQILNPVSVELIGEVVIGIVPFFLQTNEAARHRCEVRWNRTWYKRSKTSG